MSTNKLFKGHLNLTACNYTSDLKQIIKMGLAKLQPRLILLIT